jgi:hypothetical protein
MVADAAFIDRAEIGAEGTSVAVNFVFFDQEGKVENA